MFGLSLRLMDPRTLGERLREARTNARLTQDQLASKVGVSRSLISQWETGTVQEIHATSLWAASKALRVSLDWLLEGDGMEEIREPATPDEVQLLDAWLLLTPTQRARVLAEVRQMADHNRELLEELMGR